ncbi:MAG TPA: biopolymer transporter ExbD [Bacteroidia bacterium]|jgi:biopolymer transport protein ExbD|nr:biopolymer transporter ExbD [Bacteroidota bacterium]MBK9670734.1 biopolymer transporter ExbD [Bacteroidota bacterium]HRH02067.1 biopolymer transporter ExbD [Bacteroidia bacterium]HRH07629.1 biopolymer transporter ExbD [Bacteroidia bacterium]HRH64330.1 biopolymer transporter ExbD [Bacteroidia bacterium]
MSLRRNKHRFAAEVGASSMSDIMFFLMLFFLIVSTLVNPSVIKLLLPKASSVQTMSKQQFTIDISKDKEIYLNNKPIAFENLESQLGILISGVAEATVVLRVDNSLTVQDLVDVLEIGNKLKVRMVMAAKTTK